jgi:hypothetical protein
VPTGSNDRIDACDSRMLDPTLQLVTGSGDLMQRGHQMDTVKHLA